MAEAATKTINWRDLPVEDYAGEHLYSPECHGDEPCYDFQAVAREMRSEGHGDAFTVVQLKLLTCSREIGEGFVTHTLEGAWHEFWGEEGFDYDGGGDDGLTREFKSALVKVFGDIAEASAPNRADETGLLIEVTPDYWQRT